MNVVYIITKLELGGAQKVCLALFDGLKNANIPTTLISGNEGPLVAQVKNDPAAILLPALQREISLRGLFNEFRAFFNLITILKALKSTSQKPLIVHTHSTKAGILGRWAAFFARADSIVHTVHGFAFHEHQNKILWFLIFCCEWLTALITSHFIVVSSSDLKTGNKLLPGFKNNHSIIRASAFTRPNNTFTRPIRIFGEDERPFIIGTTSCFKPQKNLQDLIKIFSAFVKTTTPNARLEILGDGQQREKLENLAKEQGVADLITFAGWQSDIAPWLARWDVFALTSLWEGLPCATVEARLFKLPVIAYNTGGIKDIIFNNQNGFLVAQYDKESFLACLQKCYSDCAYYNQLASHNDDLEAFKIETMVNQHIKLYKKLSP